VRLLAAALLILAAPAIAQPGSAGPQPGLSGAVFAPSEEANTLFQGLSTHVLTDQVLETGMAATGHGVGPLDEIVERSLARGEQVQGWQDSGIDIRAAVAAREGGLAGNMAVAASSFGYAFVYYEDRPIEAIVPPDWVMVARRGAPVEGAIVQVEIGHVSPKVILAERVAYRRQGKAYCRTQAESRLYADPAVRPAEFDLVALVMTMRALRAADRMSLCEVAEETAPGRYRMRMFDGGGYRLAALDRGDIFQIVARGAGQAPARP